MSVPWPFPTNNRVLPILVGESVAELVMPRVADAALARVPPEDRAEFWHGFMAAATATMGAQVGFVAFERILQACIEYGRAMEAEEAERGKGWRS